MDIPCLQAVKDLTKEELLEILEGDIHDEGERLELEEPRNRTSSTWLRQRVVVHWLRRGKALSSDATLGSVFLFLLVHALCACVW